MIPFEFKVHPFPGVDGRCQGCKVYRQVVEVPELELALCKDCLPRLRSTLKSALKRIVWPRVARGGNDGS